MAFVMCFEDGPELDAMVRAVGRAFEIEGDIMTVVSAMSGAFGVTAQYGHLGPAAEEVIHGLLQLEPPGGSRRATTRLEPAHAGVSPPLVG